MEPLFFITVAVAAFKANYIYIFILQLPCYYILALEISTGMRAMRMKLNVSMLQLPIGANACIAKMKREK